jgi:hypothetical protein
MNNSTAIDVLETMMTRDLRLPTEAVSFLLTLWDLLQGLDDWMDDTPTQKSDRLRTIWIAIVGLNAHPFFRKNDVGLLPAVGLMVLKWQAANVVETGREVDQLPKAYIWRAGYYDVVLQVVLIVHGPLAALDLAPTVLRMYGERLEDYLKEFSHA